MKKNELFNTFNSLFYQLLNPTKNVIDISMT